MKVSNSPWWCQPETLLGSVRATPTHVPSSANACSRRIPGVGDASARRWSPLTTCTVVCIDPFLLIGPSEIPPPSANQPAGHGPAGEERHDRGEREEDHPEDPDPLQEPDPEHVGLGPVAQRRERGHEGDHADNGDCEEAHAERQREDVEEVDPPSPGVPHGCREYGRRSGSARLSPGRSCHYHVLESQP